MRASSGTSLNDLKTPSRSTVWHCATSTSADGGRAAEHDPIAAGYFPPPLIVNVVEAEAATHWFPLPAYVAVSGYWPFFCPSLSGAVARPFASVVADADCVPSWNETSLPTSGRLSASTSFADRF